MIDEAARTILSRQGYITPKCTLPGQTMFMLVMHEINAGRSPCWGCSQVRSVCGGEPRDMDKYNASVKARRGCRPAKGETE